ncbi:MAG TPA: universal stress protein [Gammaproteobacteria bacterium]|nr:universal stress protein [Gammaproteobacteria bacterium]
MADRPRYLVIVPPDLRRTAALFRAMALAKETQAEITLALFDFDAVLAKAEARGFSISAYLDGRRRELEQFTTHLRLEGFSVTTEVCWGSPFTKQVLAEVDRIKPDLVIKDVHTERALKRLLLTGWDFELLRHCPAPLMLVKPGHHNLPVHIMAAVDPLDENNRPHELNGRILGAAEKYGMVTGASVDVVHVFQPLPVMASAAGLGGSGWAPDYSLVQELRNEHVQALQALGNEYGVEERHLHILDGFPASILTEFSVTYGIDLVVMGTVSRRGLERLMLGSVAEELFQKLDCDVLAVK